MLCLEYGRGWASKMPNGPFPDTVRLKGISIWLWTSTWDDMGQQYL